MKIEKRKGKIELVLCFKSTAFGDFKKNERKRIKEIREEVSKLIHEQDIIVKRAWKR